MANTRRGIRNLQATCLELVHDFGARRMGCDLGWVARRAAPPMALAIGKLRNAADRPNPHPALIAICRSSRMAHSSVIFLPPEEHYFAAAGIKYPKIFKGMVEYTRENLVSSDMVYESFIAWMKEAGIKKDFVPADLFSPYARWGRYGESNYSTMGKRARTVGLP